MGRRRTRARLSPPAGTRAYTLDDIDDDIVVLSFPAEQPAAETRLGDAEREVAEMAARGLSNREIAKARGTSERTVANQLASIFRKLGVTSRVELARLF